MLEYDIIIDFILCVYYQLAATHYWLSIYCNNPMRWIKSVSVQVNTRRPQFVGDGEAGGGRAPGAWRPRTTSQRRCHDNYSDLEMDPATMLIKALIQTGQGRERKPSDSHDTFAAPWSATTAKDSF